MALARTDPFTQLPDRGAMVATLDDELERALRFGRRCAVLVLDVDHFKLAPTLGNRCGRATVLTMRVPVAGASV
jgi:diguanylate cyclase (GGDEF)-like protein